jgi:ATP-dependent Lhr-like helicase
LALQERTIGVRTWPEWWNGLGPVVEDGAEILQHLISAGYLETDGGLAFIGPETERRFGRRHFSDLTAVFTAPPGFTVLAGREEIGTVGDDLLVADPQDGPRVLLLAGHAWLVTYVDWKRRRCFVEPTGLPGRARWSSTGGGLSFDLTRAMRDVLLGAHLGRVSQTRRALAALAELRDQHSSHVIADRTVLERTPDSELYWWTWAGAAANRTLRALLDGLADSHHRVTDRSLRMRSDIGTGDLTAVTSLIDADGSVSVQLSEASLTGLKFSAALPMELARRTIATRLVDQPGAHAALNERRVCLRRAG